MTVNLLTLASRFRRVLDAARILASILLIIYLPALVLIAFAVAVTSAGPPFVNRVYRRSNGRTVDLWEFRTECWRQWEMTKVGRYLHRTNMYRLPSLVNVMRGDIEIGEKVKPAADWLS